MLTVRHLEKGLESYALYLKRSELAEATRKKYLRDSQLFLRWCGQDSAISKNEVLAYKAELLARHAPATVNSYLISVNRFLRWQGNADFCARTLRIQRPSLADTVLSLPEYALLLEASRREGRERDYLLLRTLAGTGIRISELVSITVEAARRRQARVALKGKYRVVFLSEVLASELLAYCEKQAILSGIIFAGKREKRALHPSGIWKRLKKIATAAGVAPEKVYPHSFRHLFAKTYMEKIGNIFELADLLGHSSVETTRVYARTSFADKLLSLQRMSL